MPYGNDEYQAYLDGYGEELSQSERFTWYLHDILTNAKNDGYSGDEQRFWVKNHIKDYLMHHADMSQRQTPRMNEADADVMARQIVDEWNLDFDEGTYRTNPNDEMFESQVPTYKLMYAGETDGDWRRGIRYYGSDSE